MVKVDVTFKFCDISLEGYSFFDLLGLESCSCGLPKLGWYHIRVLQYIVPSPRKGQVHRSIVYLFLQHFRAKIDPLRSPAARVIRSDIIFGFCGAFNSKK